MQVELAYNQQLRLSSDQRELVLEDGLNQIHEKELVWNFAFIQQFAGGRISPVFEVLGTTIIDAQRSEEQGTIVELAVGGWIVPFSDDHPLSDLSVGFGWRWPLTRRRNSDGEGVVTFQLDFE